MHDEDDGGSIRSDASDGIEAVGGGDVVPLGGQSRGDRVAMLVGHVLGALDQDAGAGRGIRHQSSVDAREEPRRRPGIGRAERLRERHRRAIGDAALELAQQPLLPRLGVVEHGYRLGAELDRRVGPPHRGIRGVESQHAPILSHPPGAQPVSTGRDRESPDPADLGRNRRAGPTGRLHGPVVVGRAALTLVARTVGLGRGIGCLARGRSAGLLAGEQARQSVVHLVAHRLLAARAGLETGDE